jgi:phospholipase C
MSAPISTAGEVHDYVSPFDRDMFHVDNLPYGLGPRVGMIVLSPWSKGGFVCSQVFDHTSIIRFIERRFGVTEPNITEWRRAVCGDLTSAFDFTAPHDDWPELPDTRDYIAAVNIMQATGSTGPAAECGCRSSPTGGRRAAGTAAAV